LPPDDLVLAFDTSAAHCAAALLSGDQVIAERYEPMEKGQAERLMPMLAEMLAEAGVAWRDLARIGVGTGPGNFTGVRIAVAAARGLALGLGIPALGVSSLQAQAFGAKGAVLSSLDARKGAIYLQSFGLPKDHAAQIFDLAHLPPLPSATCIGFAADILAAHSAGQTAPPHHRLCDAIARLAQAQSAANSPRPAPFYLRSADAAPPADPPPVILP
jgi:tRNA threonylcarbamoyl adenosine modification protein YeaZ